MSFNPNSNESKNQSENQNISAGNEGQTLIPCPSLLVKSFSFDTFHISYHAEINNKMLFERMEQAKSELQQTSDTEVHFEITKTDCFSWNLQRTGIKFYPYVLRSGDLIFAISPNTPVDSTVPNMSLMIGSLSSQGDVVQMHEMFKSFLEIQGVKVVKEMTSRSDLCADLAIHISKTRTDKISRYITRATKMFPVYEHRKYTSIQIGKGNVLCRIYDKPLEMKNKKDHEKELFFAEKWGVEIGTAITRVEFQSRRKSLVELLGEDTTLKNVVANAAGLWAYYTKKWLRQAQGFVDRDNNNQKQAVNSVFWDAVVSASGLDIEPLEREKKPLNINIPDLRLQASGCLMSCAAGLGHDIDDYFGVMSTISQMITEDIDKLLLDPMYRKKYLKKATHAKVTF